MKFKVTQGCTTYRTIEVEAPSMDDVRNDYDAYLDHRTDWTYFSDLDEPFEHLGIEYVDTPKFKDYVWPDPDGGDFWIDAWNGFYLTEAEARFDCVEAVAENRPWLIPYGSRLQNIDEHYRGSYSGVPEPNRYAFVDRRNYDTVR